MSGKVKKKQQKHILLQSNITASLHLPQLASVKGSATRWFQNLCPDKTTAVMALKLIFGRLMFRHLPATG